MRTIPLMAVPAQSLQIILDDQECTLTVYQRAPLPGRVSRLLPADSQSALYLDLDVGATRVATGAVCLDRWSIVQHAQATFKGRLFFLDTEGKDNPRWQGLGSRWLLGYEGAKEASV